MSIIGTFRFFKNRLSYPPKSHSGALNLYRFPTPGPSLRRTERSGLHLDRRCLYSLPRGVTEVETKASKYSLPQLLTIGGL